MTISRTIESSIGQQKLFIWDPWIKESPYDLNLELGTISYYTVFGM